MIDDACTSALSGDGGLGDAQARMDGPCEDARWGTSPLLVDLDRDGVEEVVESMVCDDHVARLVGSRIPVTGTTIVDREGDVVLEASTPEGDLYFEGIPPVDVDRDGQKDLLGFAIYWDGLSPTDQSVVQVFHTPTWGMTTDDADLTVELVPTTYDAPFVEGWTAALIPGDPGAVVVAGAWLAGGDWCDAATWVVPADAAGWVTTEGYGELGPDAHWVQNCLVNTFADAGDIDGDGEDELFLGEAKLLDRYLLPLTPATGDRLPDFRWGAELPYDGDYQGRSCEGGVTVVGDTDGDGTDNLYLHCSSDPWSDETFAQALLPVRVESPSSIVLDDEAPLVVTSATERIGRATLLDFDGDGALDVAVSTPSADGAWPQEGVVYIEYGPFGGTRELGDGSGARILGG